MIIDNEVRTKYKTRKRNELHSISSSIRKNSKNHDKKEDDKRK